MKVLDTDTPTLFFDGHPRIHARQQKETEDIAITIISQIEVLQGRFSMLLKAADGPELWRAQQWLDRTVHDLSTTPMPTEKLMPAFLGDYRLQREVVAGSVP